jgi:hypothetical protein
LQAAQRALDAAAARQQEGQAQEEAAQALRLHAMGDAEGAAMSAMGERVDGEPEPQTLEAVLVPAQVRALFFCC